MYPSLPDKDIPVSLEPFEGGGDDHFWFFLACPLCCLPSTDAPWGKYIETSTWVIGKGEWWPHSNPVKELLEISAGEDIMAQGDVSLAQGLCL